jgi:histone acetyltransferase (RNA polymerase elongator complex component)
MSDEVLKAAKRGHTSAHTVEASEMIVKEGLVLGHQLMLGLPASAFEDEYYTARMAAELGASQVRIYPVVVVEGTELAELWRAGKYAPLSEEEAVERTARLLAYFRTSGISVIRCGLHPSEELLGGGKCLAGPFHPAFRQKAESRVFGWMLERLAEDKRGDLAKVAFNPDDEAALYGFGGSNSGLLGKISTGRTDLFEKDEKVPKGRLLVDRA